MSHNVTQTLENGSDHMDYRNMAQSALDEAFKDTIEQLYQTLYLSNISHPNNVMEEQHAIEKFNKGYSLARRAHQAATTALNGSAS